MGKETACQECSDQITASTSRVSSLESRGNLADRGSLFYCKACGQNFLYTETTPGGSDDAMSTSVHERFDPISKEEVVAIKNAWKLRQERIRQEMNDYNDDFFDEKYADD